MKLLKKGDYLAPETEVMEIKMQGVIAESIESGMNPSYPSWPEENI
jgi:hypothetical protein